MNKEYLKGDKVIIQGEAFTEYGLSHSVSVYDEELELSVNDVLEKYDGRNIKVTIEFLD